MDELCGIRYFHGTIDTRECREMLAEIGDFLIRNHVKEMDQDEATTDCACVLTVAVTPEDVQQTMRELPYDYSEKENCKTRTKSYLITGKSGKYSIKDSKETFKTIEALCNSFIESKKPLPNGGILRKSIPRQSWQFLLADFEFPKQEIFLGKGSFGEVIKAKLKRGGNLYDVAVKTTKEGGHEYNFTEVYTEARAMRRITHPNVIRPEGVMVQKLPIMLAIEFFPGSSLIKMLQEKKVPNHMRFPVIIGIMYGLVYMHSQFYIHRDVAARNVMISTDCKSVKLIDFGLAKHGLFFRLRATQKIPKKWLAPEVLKHWTFSTKSDVWAFAITIWEIFHDGAEPYSNTSKPPSPVYPVGKKVLTKRRSKSPAEAMKHQTPEITANLEHFPPMFSKIYPLMTALGHRERIEMGALAQMIEQAVIPTLPKMSKDEALIHMAARPKFDPSFGLASEAAKHPEKYAFDIIHSEYGEKNGKLQSSSASVSSPSSEPNSKGK